MSQKKVDAYKKEKANRAATLKKQKQVRMLWNCAAVLVCIAVLAWFGFSIHQKMEAGKEAVIVNTDMNTAALDGFQEYLSTVGESEEDAHILEDLTDEEDVEEDAEVSEEEASEADEAEETEETETEAE